MPRRPTLRDVAERAGVSVSAVSYALNDRSSVPLAADTKERIRAAAEELGYVPNRVARSLQSRAARAIGVILDKPLTSPRYAGIVEGISAGLRDHDVHLTLISGTATRDAVADVRGGLLAGLIFIGHDDLSAPPELIADVQAHSIPFVALDCGEPDAAYATVDFDYAAGVRQAMAYLAAQGVTDLLYVRPDLDSRAEIHRERALAAEVDQRPELRLTVLSDGITAERLDTYDAHPESLAGTRTTLAADIARVLQRREVDPARTAVLCAWGTDAEAAYRAVSGLGSGIRVAALAAGSLALELWPDLIYSRLPLREAGRACADLIVTAIAGRAGPEHLSLTPTLEAPAAAPNPLVNPLVNGGRS